VAGGAGAVATETTADKPFAGQVVSLRATRDAARDHAHASA